MAEIDTVSKHLIQTYPADFARFALQRDDIEDVEVIESEQPTVKARRTDSLLRVRIGGEDALVHHEFQTTDHPTMSRRMAGYIGRIIEHYDLPVYSHVFYLRPAAGRRDPGYYLQENPGYQILIQYKVIRLSQLPGQEVLDRGTVGLLPFAPLMQPPAGQAEEAWLEQCIARAAALPLGQSVKADVLTGLAILSGLVYNPQTITAIVSKEHLMDLMRESSFAQYLAETIREEITKEVTEQGALLHESYSRYGFRLLFVCQLLFSLRYDWGLPTWIIRLRIAQPRRLSTCWLASLRAFNVLPMSCL